MFTTTRVSVGIAFGPGSISGLGLAVATDFVGSAEAAGAGVALVSCVLWLLFGSVTQPETKNTDKTKISRDLFISLTPSDLVRSNERSCLFNGENPCFPTRPALLADIRTEQRVRIDVRAFPVTLRIRDG